MAARPRRDLAAPSHRRGPGQPPRRRGPRARRLAHHFTALAALTAGLGALALAEPARAAPGAPTSAEATAVEVVDLTVRRPLALAVLHGAGRMETVTSEDILTLVRDELAPRTDLEPRPLPEAAAGECRGRLACLVALTRAPPGAGLASPEVQLDAPAEAPLFLLVVSVIPSERTDYVSVALLELTSARQALDESRRPSGAVDLEAAEQRILERALVGPEEHVEVASRADLAEIFRRLLHHRYRAALDEAGHLSPDGGLVVEGGEAGALVAIDGRTIGIAPGRGAALRVRGLRPGAHEVSARGERHAPVVARVEIARGATTTLVLPAPGLTARADARAALRWTAAGAALLGAATLTYALAAPSARTTCWTDCASPFKRFGAPSDPGVFDDPAGGGPPIAPIGLGLVAGGAGALGADLLFGADDTWPWLPLAIGLAAGVAVTGASVALDPAR